MRLTIAADPVTLNTLNTLIINFKKMNDGKDPDEIGGNRAMIDHIKRLFFSKFEIDRTKGSFIEGFFNGVPFTVNNSIRDGRVYCGDRRGENDL